MSIVFPDSADLSSADVQVLMSAYHDACFNLTEDHGFTAESLRETMDVMSQSLLALFKAGQQSETALSRYAVSRALEARRVPRDGHIPHFGQKAAPRDS